MEESLSGVYKLCSFATALQMLVHFVDCSLDFNGKTSGRLKNTESKSKKIKVLICWVLQQESTILRHLNYFYESKDHSEKYSDDHYVQNFYIHDKCDCLVLHHSFYETDTESQKPCLRSAFYTIYFWKACLHEIESEIWIDPVV